MTPSLVIIAGPNGSGKSTLTRQLISEGFDLGHYINPDDIAAGLVGPYARRVALAQEQADEERAACLARRISFSFETVMSHPSKVEVMRAARDAGFKVTLLFVSIANPAINVARVRSRVAAGGHDVPADRIVARWERTNRLLVEAVLNSDVAMIFDNTLLATSLAQSSDLGFEIEHGLPLQPVARVTTTPASIDVQLIEKIPEWLATFLLIPLRERAYELAANGQSLSIKPSPNIAG